MYQTLCSKKSFVKKAGPFFCVFKIMKGIVDLNYTTFFKLSTNNTRGHELKILKQKSRLNVGENFFSQRIVEAWNELPEETVNCTTVLHLKNFMIVFTVNAQIQLLGFY